MNEILFFTHIALLFGATLLAKRLGKEALMVLASLQVVLANLFVTKQIVLFGLEVTPTDAYIIGSLLTVNVLQEYFGKESARKILSINTYILVFFALMALIQIFYTPSAHDSLHPAFTAVLSQSPRVFIGSIIAFYISQRLDIEMFSFFRKKWALPIAMFSSLAISQACDTILFSYLALYGVVHSIVSIMGLSYAIKLITLFSMTPLTSFLKRAK